MNLEALGWDAVFARSFEPFAGGEYVPGRIAMHHRTHYAVYTEVGDLKGELTGKLQYQASGPNELPAVGDWVVVHPRVDERAATIVEVLPRKTQFSRKTAGRRTEEQIVAANVDTVFIVSGLDREFNVRRLERYLVLASQSGASPVVILNKTDLCENVLELKKEVEHIARQTPVKVASALNNEGLEVILDHLGTGKTGALLGSSGVGKTTIINRLLGSPVRKTAEVREKDDRGRHTTTVRELILLPSGGLLIDTPGMRELQLMGSLEGFGETFGDIEELAARCKFRDCSHGVEPGCAVMQALENGTLDPQRYEHYRKLMRELAYQHRKNDEGEQRKEKERIKKLTNQFKKHLNRGKRQ